ncbi:phage portal protein [Photobacterium rosenbergii]|uniref:Phage portal protein n=1 Tax=Photobacterium rosenbergii TaxID=294936 RepID=A0A2T3MYI8_9GAMM|nr:phage portal protein [Photobacterium rosenbergii]PSW05046.1 phage portal protein [Photobacterium rosenbergii]
MIKFIKGLFKPEEKRSNSYSERSFDVSPFHHYLESPESIPAVNQAIHVISSSIAALPLYCSLSKDIDLILKKPNEQQSYYEFILILVRSMLINGNGYIEKQYGANGRLIGLYAHNYNYVSVERVGARYRYRVTNDLGGQRVLLDSEVCHIRYISSGGIMGGSPVKQCRRCIETALGIEINAKAYQDNGAYPRIIMETEDSFKGNYEALDRLKGDLTDALKGPKRRGKTLVLESGLKAKVLDVDMVQQDFARIYRLFNVDAIGRIFNIPPMLINDLTHGTYTNSTQQAKAFHDQTLRPILQMIESALCLSLGLPTDSCIQFDASSMLRMSQTERYQSYETAIRAGFMTPDEVRQIEGIRALLEAKGA